MPSAPKRREPACLIFGKPVGARLAGRVAAMPDGGAGPADKRGRQSPPGCVARGAGLNLPYHLHCLRCALRARTAALGFVRRSK
ncbi:hypothetical protein YWS52_01630 [Chitiniphilus shinanonensis]